MEQFEVQRQGDLARWKRVRREVAEIVSGQPHQLGRRVPLAADEPGQEIIDRLLVEKHVGEFSVQWQLLFGLGLSSQPVDLDALRAQQEVLTFGMLDW